MKKLLILSTDQPTIDQLKNSLSVYNFELFLLNDPHTFFDELRAVKPDLVILDFLLNEKNGGSICHQLKGEHDTKDYPVIILSDFPEHPERFGCDAILQKPIAVAALTEHINKHLDTTSAE